MDALIIAATPESLNSIRKYVTTAAAAADLEKKAAGQLCQVVGEIATSAMAHGHAGENDKDVWRVQAHVDQKSLTIILDHRGEPYDPRQNASRPPSDASIEDRPGHTLQGVDEFQYQRVGDWNRKGRTNIGVFRTGLWVLDFNGNGQWDGTTVDRAFGFNVP